MKQNCGVASNICGNVSKIIESGGVYTQIVILDLMAEIVEHMIVLRAHVVHLLRIILSVREIKIAHILFSVRERS